MASGSSASLSAGGRATSYFNHIHPTVDPSGVNSSTIETSEEPQSEFSMSSVAPPPPPPPPPPPQRQQQRLSRSRSRSRSRMARDAVLQPTISSTATFHSADPPSSASPLSNRNPPASSSAASQYSLPEPSPTNHHSNEPSPTVSRLARLKPPQEASPTMKQTASSPLTAKTEESFSSKSSVSTRGRRHRALADHLSEVSSVVSVDPPTGRDQGGRWATLGTPTAVPPIVVEETPTPSSHAHYEEITRAATTRTESLPSRVPHKPITAVAAASPTASSLATEPHSNAQSQEAMSRSVSQTPSVPHRRPQVPSRNTELVPQNRATKPGVVANQSGNAGVSRSSSVRGETLVQQAEPTQASTVRSKPQVSSTTVNPGNTTNGVVIVNSDEQSNEAPNGKKKKGFFGKIFKRGGGRNKKKNDKSTTSSSTQSVPAVGTTAQAAKKKQQQQQQQQQREEEDEPTISSAAPSKAVSSRKATETYAENVSESPKSAHAPVDLDEEEDDDDDDEGRLPPLASPPTSNKSRPDISFLHDDVSTLTGPTLHSDSHRRKSRDPLEAFSKNDSAVTEPVGHYFNFDLDEPHDIEQRPSIDPFEEPFFQPTAVEPSPTIPRKTQSKTPTEPTPTNATRMRAGEPTPTNESLRMTGEPGSTVPAAAAKRVNEPTPTNVTVRKPPKNKANTASNAKNSHGSNLRVSTLDTIDSTVPPPHTDDPLGENATQRSNAKFHDPSPRGDETPHGTAYPDPVGESPLHKMQRGPVGVVDGFTDLAPDPPLYLTSVPSVDSSDDEDNYGAEEKKSDGDGDDEMGVFTTDVSIAGSFGDGHVGAVHPTSSELSVPAVPNNVLPPPPMRRIPPPLPSPLTSRSPRAPLTPAASEETRNRSQPASSSREEPVKSALVDHGSTQVSRKTPSMAGTRQKPRPEDNMYRRNASRTTLSETMSTPKESDLTMTEPTEPEPRMAEYVPSPKPKAPLSPATASSPGEHSTYDADTGERIVHTRSPISRKSPLQRRLQKRNENAEASAASSKGDESMTSPTAKGDLTTNKKLMISSMARMNAKAVAYLHTLNGDPSPRNAWHKPTISLDDDVTPASQARGRNSFASVATDMSTPGSKDESRKFFRAYSGKFKGRRLSSKMPTPRSRLSISKKEVRFTDKVITQPAVVKTPMNRNIEIDREVVSMGFAAFRYRREMDIISGRSQRVVPSKSAKPRAPELPAPEEPEPLDPIQRAGRRLLSKASIPIQACARRYLAQKHAVDRMWALIEIQSFMRRWRAEAHLMACTLATVTIQRIGRGYCAQKQLEASRNAAVTIQRIVRGHLASAWAFDTVYAAIIIQSLARGFFAHSSYSDKRHGAIILQKTHRAKVQKDLFHEKRTAAIRVQTIWRKYIASTRYKAAVVDIIMVQSVVRTWLGRKIAARRKDALMHSSAAEIQKMWRGHQAMDNYEKYRATRKIQALCRGFVAFTKYKKRTAASKIQAAWRGFQGYTDYIFCLVDILLVQRIARRWLAIQEANRRRVGNAATKIQTVWRSHNAQFNFVKDLADIIRVQSVARRYLSHFVVHHREIQKYEEDSAATTIQSAWRGFITFSRYIIMQFEATKLQALARGVMARKNQQFKLGCCILIQAAARRYLARNVVHEVMIEQAFAASRANEMRERLSAERIQFWWSVVIECQKEKEAALVIERFFIMVKREVEKEIRRQEKRKQEKREKRRQRKMKDDKVLERVWLDGQDDMLAYSASQSTATSPESSFSGGTRKSTFPQSAKSGFELQSPTVRHESSSPTIEMVMRHEQSDVGNNPSHGGLLIADTKSIPSIRGAKKPQPITTSVVPPTPPSPSIGVDSLAFSRSEYSDDSPMSSPSPKQKLGLATPVFSARSGSSRTSDNISKYMNMYGLKSGTPRSEPSSNTKAPHFFAGEEDTEEASPQQRGKPSASSLKRHSSAPSASSPSVHGHPPRKTSMGRSPQVAKGSPSPYQKSLNAAAKASVAKEKPSSPSPRHGRMVVMNRYQRDKPNTPSNASESDESFLAGEEFGMI